MMFYYVSVVILVALGYISFRGAIYVRCHASWITAAFTGYQGLYGIWAWSAWPAVEQLV
jgi:hypothetical protein